MPFNPYASPQAQDASRMPQTGFGQSNLSPQYGGVPNQNAFQNANPAANLYSRFGAPSEGAPSPLPGGAPNSMQGSPMGVPFGGRPTPTGYGGTMFSGQMPYNRPMFGGFSPYGGMNYLPFMTGYGYNQTASQFPQYNALLAAR